MHGRFCSALILMLLASASSRADSLCLDRARLTHSTVAITRYFHDAERAARPGIMGEQGTGWFLSPTTIVTVAHVAEAMKLSTKVWNAIEIQDGEEIRSVPARMQRLAGIHREKLAVIELQKSLSGARSLAIRTTPLVPEDHVVTLAYSTGHPRLVGGRFAQFGDDKLAGTALLEMYDGNDRLAVDHGASGAPVVDCEGRVAAVVSTVITQTLAWAVNDIRISTAWGTPNVISVPIQALKESSAAR